MKKVQSEDNPLVFLDIKIGEEKAGRIIIELFKDVVPKTSENFRALCTGEKGIGTLGKPLHYRNATFHKAVTLFMIQGGDIINLDGSSGESIYGTTFEDENFSLTHDEGSVSMANSGPNSNSSQFFITTQPSSHLDGINVVFGRIIRGFDVVCEVEQLEVENSEPAGQLRKVCVIENSGEIKIGQNWGLVELDDHLPPWPADWEYDHIQKSEDIESHIALVKESGNAYFRQKIYLKSIRKYRKCISYIKWFKCADSRFTLNSELMFNLLKLCNVNEAAAHLELCDFVNATKACDEVLKLDPENCKAIFRRGLAYIGLKNYECAMDDLNKAVIFAPNNKAVQQAWTHAKEGLHKDKAKEKHFCSKIFS